MPVAKCTVTGLDFEGRAAKESFYSDTGPHALALAQAIDAASNARFISVLGFSKQAVGGKGAALNAEFPAEEDKIVLVFAHTDGSTHKYSVPAPLLALFDTNGRTVTNAGAAATLITAYINNATNSAGVLGLSFLRGHRGFRKSRKF